MTFVSIEVEVTDDSAVSNVLIDIIHCIRLHTSGERSHCLRTIFTGMPDDALDETLASADREEVNLSGGGEESHGLLCLMNLL